MNIIHIIIYYALLIITFQYAKKKKYYYTILIIIYLFYLNNLNYFKNYDQITVIDIGQGDSILINLAHNKGTYLIDTGGKYGSTFSYAQNTTIPYLKSLGIKKIDYLILTHGDYDHAGEANYIINNFKVNHVIFNCGHYNYLERELIKLLESKNIKYASCVSRTDNLSFLQTMDFNNENDNSIVIYTKINNYSFMFMGDASIKTEAEIMKKYNLPKIDILKAGHHGSNTSSSKEFIDTINPDYTLISVGLNNKFKHPHQETLDNLVNSKIYRTDLDGSITIYIKNRQLHISSF